MERAIDASEMFDELRGKRDAPRWVKTITGKQSERVWRRLRDELPRPLSRQTWLDGLNLEQGVVAALMSGDESIADVVEEDGQRLRLLVALLTALGRGRYPDTDECLRDLWCWVWEESARWADSSLHFEKATDRLLHGEALLASGLFFTGLVGMKSRAKLGRKRLWEELAQQTDTDGMPSQTLLDSLPDSLAALVRVGRWAAACEMPFGKRGELELFEGLLRVLAAMRVEGSMLDEEKLTACVAAGGKLLGWKKSEPARKHLEELGDPEAFAGKRRRSQAFVRQSEWAGLAVCRTAWGADGDLLVVRHGEGRVQVDCSVRGRSLMSGPWELAVIVDGNDVALEGEWEAVSWFEDEEVAYLELQLTTSSDLVVCRQVMWSLDDRQLWLADAVSRPDHPESVIAVRGSLPLRADWTTQPRRPTREIQFSDGQTRNEAGTPIRLFPLSLPRDATREAPGRIEIQDRCVSARQTGKGGVYLPLLFDWRKERRATKADWRTLTVSEEGRHLTLAEAAAARIRLGRQQWLLYRNLNGAAAMRSVLGYHHNQESVIGRFTKQGEIEPLVLVEAASP